MTCSMRAIAGVGAIALAGAVLMLPGRASDNSTRKATLTETEFDKLMTSISNWGRWGKNDQLGALNLITQEKRKAAAGLVHEGVSFSLAHNVIKQKPDGSPDFVHKMVSTGVQPGADSAG